MRQLVFAIRDVALEAFNRPFFVPARGAASRMFSDEIQRKSEDNTMNHHPEDFELWCLGSWDDATGKFSALESEPERVARGVDFRQEG